ncbi:MAG: nucleotide pyrophosphohydrolase [Chlamydiae bacterium]|nr:nucleotide pyrophosphohydrolase [Chlamydiota bacterium]
MDIAELGRQLEKFAKDRDWEKFHSPKNLIMALTGEVGELNEIFQWLSEKETNEIMQSDAALAVKHELADILLYLVRLATILGVDLLEAATQKMELNQKKYPVDTSKGTHKKHHLLKQ